MKSESLLKFDYAVLVYQAGIANVFAVDCLNMRAAGRVEQRLMQSDFRTCEAFAYGLGAAGVRVASAHCNEAGDIKRRDWYVDLDCAPFAESQRPVFIGVSSDFHAHFSSDIGGGR